MRLSPLSQVRSAITGKNRFPVTIRQIHVKLVLALTLTVVRFTLIDRSSL
jgi:hypothetical protein